MKSGYLSLSLVVLALAACTGPIIMGTDAAIVYATKPSVPPSADLSLQVPQHESWCYKTMANVECYAHPQDVPPERLVNVDPPSKYPVDLPSYEERLHPPKPVVADAVPTQVAAIEQKPLAEIAKPVMPIPKPVMKKHMKKHHRKHKVVKSAPDLAVPPVAQ